MLGRGETAEDGENGEKAQRREAEVNEQRRRYLVVDVFSATPYSPSLRVGSFSVTSVTSDKRIIDEDVP
jgi:hypothetical protein